MNDAKKSNPFFGPDWSGLQKQYFDAFTSFISGQDTAGANQDQLMAWKQALDHWSDAVERSLPKENHAMFRSMRQQLHSFYSIAGEVAAMVQELTDSGRDAADWQSVMESHFTRLKADIEHWTDTGRTDNFYALPGFISPAAMWQHLQSLAPVSPKEIMARLAAVPGLGAANPVQEKFQEALRLWNEYEQNYREYVIALGELRKRGLDRLGAKVEEHALSGRKISSLREVYRLWTDANEEVFAEFAFREDYSRLYANLVNSLIACRQYNNTILDEIMQTVNLPAGGDVDTAYRRLQQMRNELDSVLEVQRHTGEELAKLRTALEDLKSRPANANAANTRRSTAGKKAKKKRKPVKKSP